MADDELDAIRRHVERSTGRQRDAFTADDRAEVGRHLGSSMSASRDIELPNESGTTDIRRDTEVSTGDSKRPTKTVYYRDSVIPARRAGEADADFSKRYRAFTVADKEAARRQASKPRSMSKGGR
jgi:hypothetical protein